MRDKERDENKIRKEMSVIGDIMRRRGMGIRGIIFPFKGKRDGTSRNTVTERRNGRKRDEGEFI